MTLFWCRFPRFICRNHPFLLQRFWQTIRGWTRWEWLRRRLKAQPIWTLFPAVPFLNHHLMSAANAPYLAYTCPHFCSLPLHHLPSLSPPRSSFFLYSARLYFKGRWGNCVSNPTEVKLAQSRRQSLWKKVICAGVNDQVCEWSGWLYLKGGGKSDAKASCWRKPTNKGMHMFDLRKVQKNVTKNH